MFDSIFYIFLFFGIFGVIIWILYRRFRNFTKSIRQELNEHNFTLIKITPVPLFSKCPFPNEVFSVGVNTEIMGVSGEEAFHRFVSFKDSNNQEHKVRIMIYTVAFTVKKIRWEKKLGDF